MIDVCRTCKIRIPGECYVTMKPNLLLKLLKCPRGCVGDEAHFYACSLQVTPRCATRGGVELGRAVYDEGRPQLVCLGLGTFLHRHIERVAFHAYDKGKGVLLRATTTTAAAARTRS